MDQNFVAQGSARDFMHKVYGWMSAALVVTAAVAYYVASTPVLLNAVVTSTPLAITLFIAQIGLVIYLVANARTMSYSSGIIALMAYAALMGVSISVILAIFTAESVYLAFGVTAGMFLSMAAYGYFTKADLSGMGSFLMMGLFGLIFTGILNIFFQSPMMQWLICLAGVAIFTLLTAYDVQKIKQLGQSGAMDPDTKNKMALVGALTLYLDFINLFLYIVQLLGKQRR